MSGLNYDRAKRRDQALAGARATREAQRAARAPLPPGAAATDRQRHYLTELYTQLGLEAPDTRGLTAAVASHKISTAKVALTRARYHATCPICGAEPNDPCTGRNGRPRKYLHTERPAARSHTT